MWLCVAAMLVGADPLPADAKAAFDRMEQQVLNCKTFQMQLEVEALTGKEVFMAMKGKLLVSPGDKVRLEIDGTMRGKAEKLTMISDGTKQRMMSNSLPAQDQDTKKGLGKLSLTSVSRFGVMPSMFMVAPRNQGEKGEFDPNKEFPIAGLKFGKKEAIAGVEAQSIEYQITPNGTEAKIGITVWLDIKSMLPVKRIVQINEGARAMIITETYSKATVDGKIDAKEFEVSK